MQGLLTYVTWRGDLDFNQSPLNPVDALLFSLISYIPFDGIIPEGITKKTCILSEAATLYFSRREELPQLIREEDAKILQVIAQTKRFASLKITAYLSETDPTSQKQFSALTFILPTKQICIAFRGTDLSLTGWKEDFNMSFMSSVPSQIQAVRYLSDIAHNLKGDIILCGHSKGGNLAMYAGTFAHIKIQRRIFAIYNNDGPGLHEETLTKPQYRAIQDKIQTFVPQSSLIGLLLEHEEKIIVIESTASTGLFQHNPHTWQVSGTNFIKVPELSRQSQVIDKTLKTWLKTLSQADREHFVETFFSVLSSTGAQDLSELSKNWLKNAIIIAKALKTIDAPTKKKLHEMLAQLVKIGMSIQANQSKKGRKKIE